MIFPISQINDLILQKELSKEIFSIWGDFGTGKTTIALQTAINHAKLGERIVYIYTKPNLPLQKIKSFIQQENDELLDEIIFINTLNFDDLYTIIFNLEFLILSNLEDNINLLNLIIIDSMTDLYRIDLNIEKKDKNINLNYKLNQMLGTLKFINQTYEVEILVLNELSRKTKEGITIEIQSGGKVMEYWVPHSIKINRTDKITEREIIVSLNKESGLIFRSNLTEKGFQ